MKNDLIILIEDDPQQSASIIAAIQRRFRDLHVALVETESEFYERIAAMPVGGVGPRMVISDVMLPWTFPTTDAPKMPKEVAEGTFRQAGVRCWQLFRSRADLRSIPWIYFTVLDEKTIDLQKHSDDRTGYAQKSGSIEPLLDAVKEFLDDDWTGTDEQVTQNLVASPKMRKILLEGLNSSLDDCTVSLP